MISTAARPKTPVRMISADLAPAPATPDSPPAPPPPVTSPSPSSSASATYASNAAKGVSVWLRWAVSPAAALRVLVVPPVLALPAALLLPRGTQNPFTAFFWLSHAAPPPERAGASTYSAAYRASYAGADGPQHYLKGPLDLLLLGYLVVLFSFLRLVLSHYAFPALARRWGVTKQGKIERFGEQGYAVVYFAAMGVWGAYILSTAPSSYASAKSYLHINTKAFWEDYPHTHMGGPLKAYYLAQIAYWCQQFTVLGLGLEKRRSDHWELVVHHVVTIWMVTWSYEMRVVLLGNAVFVSMDVPDVLLAFSKMLNYLKLERAKVVSFAVFVVGWTYFRHYISICILWSLQYEFHLVPQEAQIFAPRLGLYMAPWIRDQMFYALSLLQALNLFWYYLILRILVRTILSSETEDNRSDDEDEVDVVGDTAVAAPLLLSDSDEKSNSNAGALPLAGLLGEKALPLLLGVGEKAGRLEKSILDEREEKRDESENGKRDGEDRLGASLKRDTSKTDAAAEKSERRSGNRKERGNGLTVVGNA
ncbi:TLC domain-containing protein [Mycena albidolilacea]|uniref:TLC domain-containing protein n=1 Tax=Mycena albidolilacea TaxID=1033008 RepID=A0AAD7EKT9_9AGAR|nr:TLC domain-containing protein [Mycena albidolilacea]